MTRLIMGLVGLILTAAFSPRPAEAQTAPSAAQIAQYSGLHRAAHQGTAADITRLAAAGADVNARDPAGRAPIHVAAFASNDQALEALAKAGADMNTLDGQAYDVVTIAAVADDPALMSRALALGNRADLVTRQYAGTALIAAAHLGHVDVVQRLIDAGAPLDHIKEPLKNLGIAA